MAYLIEHHGERMIVEALDGHDDCTILSRNVKHPGHGHGKWTGRKWVQDDEAKAIADEEARLQRMSRSELLAEAVKRSRSIAT